MKRLGGVFESEAHPQTLEGAERGRDARLRDVLRLYRDVGVRPDEIQLAEDLAPMQIGREILEEWQRVPIRYRYFVEGAVIAAGAPLTRGGLRRQVERGGPAAL